MTKLPFILVVLSLASLLGSQKKEIPGPLAEKGELLFSDDFARKDIGEKWQVSHDAFRIRDSVLIGKQVRDDHGAIGKVHVPMKDVVVSFRFKLAGSPRFNVVFDDKQHQESHAGHLIRVAVAKKQIRLGDDREGVMRKDIREMRLDPTKKEAVEKLLEGKGTATKVDLESDRWYSMTIEIVGDKMRVSLDEKPIGFLQSPGLAHPTKESVHFTISGSDTHIDDVKIWKAKM